MSIVFSCQDVARTFGTGKRAFVALHGVTCQAESGDRIALVGPSGSGKSTLLQLLAGLDQPSRGLVTWPGLDSEQRGLRGRWDPFHVAMVFQNESLVPGLTALENVALPLVLSGHSAAKAEPRALDVMEQVGVASLATRLPHELSGGQSQRVAVARVLVTRPALVLADEPTGRLDHDTAAVVVDALLGVVDEVDAAVVIATHDPAISDRLNRQWRMRDGRLVDDVPLLETGTDLARSLL